MTGTYGLFWVVDRGSENWNEGLRRQGPKPQVDTRVDGRIPVASGSTSILVMNPNLFFVLVLATFVC